MNNNYHFDITPHIVKQLGEQLVSDEVTALLELIKNAYDADANYVSIDINTKGQYTSEDLIFSNHKGYIAVEDDGFGMSEETIIKSWLLISYSKKREQKAKGIKTPKGRTPLGEKGLGRLSTQRLADICEILTNTNNQEGTHLAFNWKDFEKKDRLSEVRITSEEYSPKINNGTKLILTNLNHAEVWEGKNLERFKGAVSQIISPYKENRPFDVYLTVNNEIIDLEKINQDLRSFAISKFEFSFNERKIQIKGKTRLSKFIGNKKADFEDFLQSDNGKKFYSFLNDKKYNDIILSNHKNFFIELNNVFTIDEIPGLEIFNGEIANPGAFKGIIDEFSYDNWLTHDERINSIFNSLTNYRTFTQSQAGIKLFRNGFAIKPFGINGEDWLKLSDSQTKASSYYPLRPKNVIGYFAIDEGINRNLKDKTDREGLVSNPYSRNFFTMALFITRQINSYQERIRRVYNEYLKTYKTKNSGIKTTTQSFNHINSIVTDSTSVAGELKDIGPTVNKLANEQADVVNDVINNSLFASEENKENVKKAQKLLSKLQKIQAAFLKVEAIIKKTEKLNDVINILEPKIRTLEEQLDNFSELAGLGITAESISHEFLNIADNLNERALLYQQKLKDNRLTESDSYILLEYINETVNGLKIQLRHIDPALKYKREKKGEFSLSKYLSDEKEYYKKRFQSKGIDVIIDIKDDFSLKINKGKLTQIIDNILINSEYWLKEKKLKEKLFTPQIHITVEQPWLYISDNGFGIPKNIENQIFEPFVSTKPKEEGRGLGLFIVMQLLDAMNCTISLEPKRNEFDKRYIFAINLSNVMI
ncbi:wide host range VirA protein [Kordia sp. SMS9]|uniref:ATP-binding protein n=1 Tax=Kordia sp. SMS9 TaxID=2282170 RepID=UPI000E0D7395|nr:ATP-binding protein [Kordia sp. SMS9]AXG72434.1 wide host range VirA protein [Kordia sp. SMS9]